MDNPRPEKVSKVAEIEQHFSQADTVLLTEYRGLDVPALAELRRELRAAGGTYKIYKNTLVRLAARNAGVDIEDLLNGPTAIAFVGGADDGTTGDAAAAAKAIRDFAKKSEFLVLKGGLVDGAPMSVDQLTVLADLPPRDVLLAQIAGAFAAPMQQFAGLLQALPRNLAYGLKALVETKPAEVEPAETEPTEVKTDESDTETDSVADAEPEAAHDAADQTESPAAEATTEETPAEAGPEQES